MITYFSKSGLKIHVVNTEVDLLVYPNYLIFEPDNAGNFMVRVRTAVVGIYFNYISITDMFFEGVAANNFSDAQDKINTLLTSASSGGSGTVNGVTGDLVDNTDTSNPIIGLAGIHELPENAEVDLNGNSISFTKGGTPFLIVETTPGQEEVSATTSNDTGGGNGTSLQSVANGSTAVQRFHTGFNDNEHETNINATSDASGSSISYSSEKHQFTGPVIGDVRIADNFADDSSAEIGNIQLGQKYHTSGVVKVRIV